LANATDRHNKKPIRNNNRSAYNPKDKWYSHDNKNKEIWDQLDDKSKAIILGYGNTNSYNNIPKSNNASYSQPLDHFQHRQANLHEMSAYDLLQAFMHQTDMIKSDENHEYGTPDECPSTSNEVKDNDTMLANAAKGSTKLKLSPGDIRSVMSKSSTLDLSIKLNIVSPSTILPTVQCHLLTSVQMVESLEMMFVSSSRKSHRRYSWH
jgi:hypothetical protein